MWSAKVGSERIWPNSRYPTAQSKTDREACPRDDDQLGPAVRRRNIPPHDPAPLSTRRAHALARCRRHSPIRAVDVAATRPTRRRESTLIRWHRKGRRQIHVIADNLSTHKTKDVDAFLAAHPSVHFALHADLLVVAQPGRTLVCEDRAGSARAGDLHIGPRPGAEDPALHRALQHRPETDPLDLPQSGASHYYSVSRYGPLATTQVVLPSRARDVLGLSLVAAAAREQRLVVPGR